MHTCEGYYELKYRRKEKKIQLNVTEISVKLSDEYFSHSYNGLFVEDYKK